MKEHTQVNIQGVIKNLSARIANLATENAVLVARNEELEIQVAQQAEKAEKAEKQKQVK